MKKLPESRVDFVAPIDPFDAVPLLRGVMRYAKQRNGWRVRVWPGHSPNIVGSIAALESHGVIAIVELNEEEAYAGLNRPVVCPFGVVPHERFPCARPDDEEIGRLGADHLLTQGHERVAFYGVVLPWSLRRFDGWSSVLKRHARTLVTNQDAEGNWPDWSTAVDQVGMSEWLKGLEKPVAVMACNDGIAVMMIEATLNLDLRVPEDVAVLGVDNQELQCHIARVPLSSVDRNAEKVGYASAELLDRVMNGKPPPAHPVIVPPRGVSARRSTELSSFADPQVTAAIRFIRTRAATGKPVSVDEVAEAADVSRSSLERRFQEVFKRSPGAEIRRVRLERVRDLLLETDMELIDVAIECGYKHLSHLSAAFKEAFGEPPSVYRSAHRRH